jgi:hypothetical protein
LVRPPVVSSKREEQPVLLTVDLGEIPGAQ